MLEIQLPDEIEDRLSSLAAKTGKTKDFYAKEAILTHLEDIEDYYLAAKTIDEVRDGSQATYTNNQVRTLLELDD